MNTFLTIIHVFVCVFLILVVLLQAGKGGGMGIAFGGGGSQTAFGARGGATLLTKMTTVCAVLFMLGALVLAILGQRGPRSLVSGAPAPPTQQKTLPAAPAGTKPTVPPGSAAPVPASPVPTAPAPAQGK